MKGTFTAADQSSPTFKDKEAYIILTFAGTATVVLESDANGDGTWETIETHTATPEEPIYYQGPSINLRLRCTAHTNNVDYEVRTGM